MQLLDDRLALRANKLEEERKDFLSIFVDNVLEGTWTKQVRLRVSGCAIARVWLRVRDVRLFVCVGACDLMASQEALGEVITVFFGGYGKNHHVCSIPQHAQSLITRACVRTRV